MAKAKQLLLVALSTDQAGEAWNALALVKRVLGTIGVDIHGFVDGMGGRSSAPDPWLVQRVQRLENDMLIMRQELGDRDRTIRRLEQENLALRQTNSPQGSRAYARAQQNQAGAQHRHHMPQQRALWLLENRGDRLRPKELDFLATVAQWRGDLTEKQQAWFDDLWELHGDR